MTRKWNTFNYQSNANYDEGSEVIYNTKSLKSSFCDYNDVYILVRGYITIIRHRVTQVVRKNWTPFIKCIKKVMEKQYMVSAPLDSVMPMNNLIEYSSNYSETTKILWFYSSE